MPLPEKQQTSEKQPTRESQQSSQLTAEKQTAETTSRRGIAVWLATGLGLGFSPVMPGTVGTLWGLPLAWQLSLHAPGWLQGMVTLALVAVGVPLCTRAAAQLGGKKDPGSIVWDEIASFPIVFWGHAMTPLTLALGFVLHRLFDITKPPPTRVLERWPRGWGIMADDVMAAVYANLALWALHGLGVAM